MARSGDRAEPAVLLTVLLTVLLAGCTDTASDTQPTDPGWLGTWSTASLRETGTLVVINSRALVCGPDLGINGVNVRDPANPAAAEIVLSVPCSDLATAVGWVYFVGPQSGMQVRKPSTWEVKGTYELGEGLDPQSIAFDTTDESVWVTASGAPAGDTASDATSWVGQIPVQAPADMHLKTEISPEDTDALDAVTDAEGIYVALSDGSVAIYDRSGAAAGTHPGVGWGTGRRLSLFDHTLFLARGAGGLEVVDVSSPAEPTLIDTLTPDGRGVTAVRTDADRLYVGLDDGLAVYDISDPASPRQLGEIGEIGVNGSPVDIFVAGGMAYVVDGTNDALLVVDVNEAD